jgi:uncharacterized membrane protein
MEREARVYTLAAAAGLIAGLRSISGLATVGTALERGGWRNQSDPLVGLTVRLAPFLRAAALAEMAADKLPSMPNRTAPPILAGRLLFGATSGLLLARAAGRNPLPAVLLATLAALAATHLGLRLRRLLSETIGLPVVAGLVEDSVVVGAASALVGQAAGHPPAKAAVSA